ncbi:MAG: glycosyltransferase family 4 protein [Acidobacteriaceae bacterium]
MGPSFPPFSLPFTPDPGGAASTRPSPTAQGGPRICIVADNASTRFGGESFLPLNYFRLLRRRGLDAWLVVHERVRPELETLLPDDLNRMHFVHDSRLHKLLFQLGKPLPRRVRDFTTAIAISLLTQWMQRRIVRSLVRTRTIDVVHQPSPVSPRAPSLLWDLGAPVVIGPMNGGMEYPPALRTEESPFTRIFVPLARAFTGVANVLLPGKRKAAVLLVANDRTRLALPRSAQTRVVMLVENGVDLATWDPGCEIGDPGCATASPLAEVSPALPARPKFVFIGSLVDWKGVHFALRALAQVPEAELHVVGSGPMRASWRNLAYELRIGHRVHFHGWLTQQQCAEQLRHATALVLPSVCECGGAVVLEAMALGRPVIATQWGGPVDYITADCGILVPPASREAMIDGLAQAMQRLASDPALVEAMGAAGRCRLVEHFTWERKIDAILDVYRAAWNSDGQRPLAEAGIPLPTFP